MAQKGFGAILREARDLKGYDLPTAARRLRIRVDILRAIEEEDFSRMPPRGYARSMVNAYARLVGLNPSEITKMYLDEAYAYQVGRARSTTTHENQFDMGPSSRRAAHQQGYRRGGYDERTEHQGLFERAMFDDRRDYLQDDLPESYDSGRRSSRDRTHPSRNTIIPNRPTTNLYAGPRSSGFLGGKLPLIVAIAVFVVLLIVVLVFVFGGKSTPPEEAPKVPITGVTDTTGESTQDSAVPAPTEQPPTSVKVTYEVAPGKEAYLAILNDGTAQDVTCVGGETESFDVTGEFSIATFRPDDVTVTVDGKPVEFTQDGTGQMPSITVSFQQYLTEWEQAHPNAPKTSTNATDNAGTTGSASNTTGSTGSTNSTGSNASGNSSATTDGTSSGSQGYTTAGVPPSNNSNTTGSSSGTSA